MEYFYDLARVDAQDMPGRKRRLVIGKNLMLVYVEREGGTTQNHSHNNEQLVYLQKGKARFTVAGVSREIEAGQVVHIPAGVLISSKPARRSPTSASTARRGRPSSGPRRREA